MMLGGFILLFVWGMGSVLKISSTRKNAAILLVIASIIALHIALPDGHFVRIALGERAQYWGIGLGLALVIFAYAKGLKWLRHRHKAIMSPRRRQSTPAADNAANNPSTPLKDAEIDRNTAHIMLQDIGGGGQQMLKSARVLIIGAGGLGCPAIQYLGAAGIGTVGIVDGDVVEHSNLSRQVIYTPDDVGVPKVECAHKLACRQNPFITVHRYYVTLDQTNAPDLFDQYDLILDCTDNAHTRYLINQTAMHKRRAVVSGAISQWEGQISIFDTANGHGCYQCLFPKPDPSPSPPLHPQEELSCAHIGVLAPLPGVIGTLMAVETIKVITGAGTSLAGYMLLYNALNATMRKISFPKNPTCAVCGAI